LALFDNVYSSKFGTFLGNSDRERKLLGVEKRTISLWSYLNEPNNLKTYLNVLYEPNKEAIWPSATANAIRLWSGFYLRHQYFQDPLIEAKQEILKLKEKETELKAKAIQLRK
jgi:hypothetical protein